MLLATGALSVGSIMLRTALNPLVLVLSLQRELSKFKQRLFGGRLVGCTGVVLTMLATRQRKPSRAFVYSVPLFPSSSSIFMSGMGRGRGGKVMTGV